MACELNLVILKSNQLVNDTYTCVLHDMWKRFGRTHISSLEAILPCSQLVPVAIAGTEIQGCCGWNSPRMCSQYSEGQESWGSSSIGKNSCSEASWSGRNPFGGFLVIRRPTNACTDVILYTIRYGFNAFGSAWLIFKNAWERNAMNTVLDAGASGLGSGKVKRNGDSFAGEVFNVPCSSRPAALNCRCCACGSISKRHVLGRRTKWGWREQAGAPSHAVAIPVSTRFRNRLHRTFQSQRISHCSIVTWMCRS